MRTRVSAALLLAVVAVWPGPTASQVAKEPGAVTPPNTLMLTKVTSDEADAEAIRLQADSVESISIHGRRIKDVVAEAIASARKLKVLNLRGCELNGHQLAVIGRCASLEEGWLVETKYPPGSLAGFAGMKKLRKLYLWDTATGDEDLAAIGKIPTLTDLDLSNTRVTEAGLIHLRHLPLVRLRLNRLQITGAFLGAASRWRLEYLDLSNTPFRDGNAPLLGRHKSLRFVALAKTNASSCTGAAFASLTRLHHLNLEGSLISSEGIQFLRGHPALERLWLSDTRINDAAMRAIASVPRLTDLDVRKTGITDAGVQFLLTSRQLKSLMLNGKQVAEPTLSQLRKNNPHLETNLDPGSLVGDD